MFAKFTIDYAKDNGTRYEYFTVEQRVDCDDWQDANKTLEDILAGLEEADCQIRSYKVELFYK